MSFEVKTLKTNHHYLTLSAYVTECVNQRSGVPSMGLHKIAWCRNAPLSEELKCAILGHSVQRAGDLLRTRQEKNKLTLT